MIVKIVNTPNIILRIFVNGIKTHNQENLILNKKWDKSRDRYVFTFKEVLKLIGRLFFQYNSERKIIKTAKGYKIKVGKLIDFRVLCFKFYLKELYKNNRNISSADISEFNF